MGLGNTYPIDTALQLEDGAVAIAATETNSGGEIDLGASNVHGAVVIQCSQIDIANDDEVYHIEWQGTNTTGFGTAADIVNLAGIDLGAHQTTGATPGDSAVDSTTGVYYVPFCNDYNGTTYQFVRLRCTVAGTSPTITYTAFLSTAVGLGS